jgi:3-methylcrotonyl-CoA carboxylase alpha subunit
MTDAVRKAMGEAAVTAAKAIGYAGAGTIEFIVDGSDGLRPDGFWFMEMNTRLQVEHPVTEAITGVDLVEWQLRVASGAPLPCAQADLTITGHAMEARLYAEDVPAGFLPATGVIDHLTFPDAARIDSGVAAGSEISPWYDPMIAGACRALSAALQATEVAGTVTNLEFLRRLARQPAFVAGDVDTGLIARDAEALCAAPVPAPRDIAVACVVAAGIAPGVLTGFALWSPLSREIVLSYGDQTYARRLVVHDDACVDVLLDDQVLRLIRHGDHWGVPAIRHGSSVTVFGPETLRFEVVDPLDRASAGLGGDTVLAPMPGLVRDVAVALGQRVAEGDRLIVLEAMKMEHVLRAPRDGVVDSVAVVSGDQVTAGALMVALEPDP